MKLQIHRFESKKSKTAFSKSKIYHFWAQQTIHDLVIPVCHSVCPLCPQAQPFPQRHQYIPCLWPHTWSQAGGGGRNRKEIKLSDFILYFFFLVMSLWRMIRHKEQKGKKKTPEHVFSWAFWGFYPHQRFVLPLYNYLFKAPESIFSNAFHI